MCTSAENRVRLRCSIVSPRLGARRMCNTHRTRTRYHNSPRARAQHARIIFIFYNNNACERAGPADGRGERPRIRSPFTARSGRPETDVTGFVSLGTNVLHRSDGSRREIRSAPTIWRRTFGGGRPHVYNTTYTYARAPGRRRCTRPICGIFIAAAVSRATILCIIYAAVDIPTRYTIYYVCIHDRVQ